MTKNLSSAFDFPFNLVDLFEHIFNVKPTKSRCAAHMCIPLMNVCSPFSSIFLIFNATKPKQKFSNALEPF